MGEYDGERRWEEGESAGEPGLQGQATEPSTRATKHAKNVKMRHHTSPQSMHTSHYKTQDKMRKLDTRETSD